MGRARTPSTARSILVRVLPFVHKVDPPSLWPCQDRFVTGHSRGITASCKPFLGRDTAAGRRWAQGKLIKGEERRASSPT